jgi:uncharacterized protein (TIGR03086 family)
MNPTELLDQGYAWTSARIAAVPPDGLDLPTPCSLWNLQQLLDHTVSTMAMLTDAAATGRGETGPVSTPWDEAIADLAERSRRAWQAPTVMDGTMEITMGTVPAPVLASISLLELVVHGWDISQATGEAADIPDALALPTLDFVRQALDDDTRGENFAADLAIGDTPSDQLVAFLGRKPR